MTVSYALDGRTMPSANASIDYPNAYKKLIDAILRRIKYIYACIYIYYFAFSCFHIIVISVLIMCALDSSQIDGSSTTKNEKLNDRNWNVRVNCEIHAHSADCNHVSWILENEFRNAVSYYFMSLRENLLDCELY